MCAPKIKTPPPAAQFQQVQAPKDLSVDRNGMALKRRRGLWSSIMTSPSGIGTAPMTTGGSASTIGA